MAMFFLARTESFNHYVDTWWDDQQALLICPFSLAATEYGFECYCGDVLVDSWLRGGDSDCNKPRPAVATGNRDCEWAMSLWNADDGKVPRVFGPQEHFVPPTLAPGEIDVLAYVGGLRQTAVLVATPVYEWPAGSHTLSSSSSYASNIDMTALAASVYAIVSAAMKQAQGLVVSEVCRKVYGDLIEKVAKAAIDSTTTTTFSTTTLMTTVICTESTSSLVTSNSPISLITSHL
ncbi:hypothetical protein QC762_505043 [Podospora pseudocomata]|uniref:Uncharacterized protein n=1 Tax=Podospora pseudocomata TaxID=2093779 RepID=A0ABR0GBK5_9PEZI|nr:hypothetical protein QC762_505043 [Podospora pseudocomata]